MAKTQIEIELKINGKLTPLYELSEETLLNARNASKPEILVPSEIQICKYDGNLWICNDKKQMLGRTTGSPMPYAVLFSETVDKVSCRLTPCSHSDLKRGDLVLNRSLISKDNFHCYGVVMTLGGLDNGRCIEWHGDGSTDRMAILHELHKVEPC